MMKYIRINEAGWNYTCCYENDRLIKIFKEKDDELTVDSIVHGRVKLVDKRMRQAFVDIGEETEAFFIGDVRELKGGDDGFFNVRKLPDSEKNYAVDGDIKLIGETVILFPKLRCIKNVNGSACAEELNEISKREGVGAVLRSKASEFDSETVKEEFISLIESYREIEKKRFHLPIPKTVFKAKPLSKRFIKNNNAVMGEVYELNKIFAADEQLLYDGVIGAGELNIIIDTRPHFCFVDFNGGNYSRYDDVIRNRYEINMELFKKALDIIELRGIDGVILIDLLKTDRAHEEKFVECIRGELKKYKINFHDITSLGIMELTKKRVSAHKIESEDVKVIKKYLLNMN